MTDPMSTVRRLFERLPPSSEIGGRLLAAGLAPSDVRTQDDLARIAVLRKEDLPALQRQPGGLGSLLPFGGISRAGRIFYSPGGILDFEERGAKDYWRSAQGLEAAGIGAGDVVLNTFSHHMTPAARFMEEAALAAGASVVPAGPGQIRMQLDILRRLGVTAYVGLPSFLSLLADAAREQQLDWRADLRLTKALVGAEPISASARERFARLGIAVFDFYGTADAGMVGYECDRHQGWHVNEGIIVQVCDPDDGRPLPDGEAGEAVLTLPREFYPLVRFATGDLSRLERAPCACGRPGTRLMGVLGRVNEAVKVRGLFVYPSFAAQIARAHDWIEAVRLRVERAGENDSLRILLLPKAGVAPPADLSPVSATVREVCKLRGELEIVDAVAFRVSGTLIEDARKNG